MKENDLGVPSDRDAPSDEWVGADRATAAAQRIIKKWTDASARGVAPEPSDDALVVSIALLTRVASEEQVRSAEREVVIPIPESELVKEMRAIIKWMMHAAPSDVVTMKHAISSLSSYRLRVERLTKALRDHAIEAYMQDGRCYERCLECYQSWDSVDPEDHIDDCLAALSIRA